MRRELDHYLGLSYPVELIREEGGVFAFHPDLDGCAAQGATVEEALANLDEARKLWIEARIDDGLQIEEPLRTEQFSGRISLRMSSELHAQLARIARRQRVSLNQLMNTALAEYAGGNRMASQLISAIDEVRENHTDHELGSKVPAASVRKVAGKCGKP